jgi:hypothetical protein
MCRGALALAYRGCDVRAKLLELPPRVVDEAPPEARPALVEPPARAWPSRLAPLWPGAVDLAPAPTGDAALTWQPHALAVAEGARMTECGCAVVAFDAADPSEAGLPATDDANAGAAKARLATTVRPAKIRGLRKRRTEPANPWNSMVHTSLERSRANLATLR